MSSTQKTYPYRWHWRKRLPQRFGEPCRILIRGKMNSCLIEFRDRVKIVTSRWALRKRHT